MAGGKRLEKYGDYGLIDNLVKSYAVYTHDDIFNLEVVMVHNMIIYNRETGYVEAKSNDIQRQAKK